MNRFIVYVRLAFLHGEKGTAAQLC